MLNPEQFHPNVDHYRDGGLGGDENHNVVGFVPTKHLLPMREYDRAGADGHDGSRETINRIRGDIRQGRGITNPIEIHYNNKEQWGFIGEGNHRLQAAVEEGVSHVPARVVRSYNGPKYRKDAGVGAHIEHDPIPGVSDRDAAGGYFPSDAHPKYLFGPNNERTPLSAGQFKEKQIDDIMGLLGH